MAMKEYLLNTIYGITTAEMTTEEHEALAKKAGLKVEQRAIFANAAMILELLDDAEPQTSASIAELAGIDAEKSASWGRALAALSKAELVIKHGHGPKTAYTRIAREEPEVVEEELPAPEAWTQRLHHTLFYGMAGSGKSNALQGVIRELAPAVEAGTAKLYGIDPKGSELKLYEGTALFEKVSLGLDDEALAAHAAVIAEVEGLITARTEALKNRPIRFDSPVDLGRHYTPSAEEPLVVLVIEELLGLLYGLQRLGKEASAASTVLTKILAMGRSLGVYIVATTQEVDKALFGRMRGNFGNVVVFHQTSRYFNDWFLGEDAAERGFDSTTIPAATYANNYETAGVAFEQGEYGDPVKVRFPYLSDEEIAELVRSFQKDADGEEAA